ncbi:MAG: Sec-independent protein translocase protein TatB [Actinomycetota bacterium]
MPSIGPLEILFVGIIALIVFGPQRLPEIARSIGKTVAELRRQAADVRAEFESGLEDEETDIHLDRPKDSGSPTSGEV